MKRLSIAGVVAVVLYLLALVTSVVIDGQDSLEEARAQSRGNQESLVEALDELDKARSDLSTVIAQNKVLSEQLRRHGVEPIEVAEYEREVNMVNSPSLSDSTSPRPPPPPSPDPVQPPPQRNPPQPPPPEENEPEPDEPEPEEPGVIESVTEYICEVTPILSSVLSDV